MISNPAGDFVYGAALGAFWTAVAGVSAGSIAALIVGFLLDGEGIRTSYYFAAHVASVLVFAGGLSNNESYEHGGGSVGSFLSLLPGQLLIGDFLVLDHLLPK